MPSNPPSLRRPSPVRGVSYDTVKAGKAPIPIQVAPKPSQARIELHPSMRPSSSPEPEFNLRPQRSYLRDQDERRDSGLGTATSTKRQSRATTVGTDRTDADSTKSGKTGSVTKKPSLPRMTAISDVPSQRDGKARMGSGIPSSLKDAPPTLGEIPHLSDSILSTDIPSFSLEDLSGPNGIQFSKRGSLLLKGQRPSTSPSLPPRSPSPALPSIPQIDGPDPEPFNTPRARTPDVPKRSSLLGVPDRSPPAVPMSTPRPRRSLPVAISRLSTIQTRPITSEEETMSRRILSMYEEGAESTSFSPESGPIVGMLGSDRQGSVTDLSLDTSPVKTISSQHSRTSVVNPPLPQVLEREENETAGGMEDWKGVRSDQVDRYGFISKPPELSITSSTPTDPSSSQADGLAAPEGHGLSRMATQLKLAAETPRRSRSIRSRLGSRRLSTSGSSRSVDPGTGARANGDRRGFGARPTSSQASYRSTRSNASSRLRRAANHLPQNRSRRAIDEAGDMLTLPPGLAEVAEAEALRGDASSKAIEAKNTKERSREEKWRKMAKVVKTEQKLSKGIGRAKTQRTDLPDGGGMQFTFDTTNSKLVSRTWKGIPDRWRATAWWSFLATSAAKDKAARSETELISIFYELLNQPSPDDVQIDLDVPRTIGGHVMFRKRYRGGQRLLFRVLHSLSLYFPDPGYVQGMAALAATFLCYFQEDLAFVMLVRMWELRGLAKLYRAGFEGLMTALSEFEHQWLEGGTVGEKLKELGITPTAYGTRWYLTVFNYSIPFSAQLRVWDVFLLLGDVDPALSAGIPRALPNKSKEQVHSPEKDKITFDGNLDILHATSAALIDATREILLDSDFENAMKTLTSWIPVRDEDMLMRVAKIEYKLHKQQSQGQRGR